MKFYKLLTLFVALSFSGSLRAQNYIDVIRLAQPDIQGNARSMGMGNAYSAISDDFAASLFNPAGLAQMSRMEIAGGFDLNSMKNNSLFFGNKTDYSSTATNLNQFGFAIPLPVYQGSFAIGLGYSVKKSFNGGLKFDGFNPSSSMIEDLTSRNDDIAYKLALSYPVYDNSGKYLNDRTIFRGRLNQSGTTAQDGTLGNWSMSAAAEIAPAIYFGATLNVLTGTYKSTREYYEDDYQGIYSDQMTDPSDPTTKKFKTFYLKDQVDWDISGWNLKLGLLYKLDQLARFGVTIQTPTRYTIKETYSLAASSSFTGQDDFVYNPDSGDPVEYDVKTPYEFTGAAAVYLRPSLTPRDLLILSAEATYMDYSQSEFTDGPEASTMSRQNQEIKEFLSSKGNYHLGFEYNVPSVGLRIRGGYANIASAFKDDPSKYSRQSVSFGLGVLAQRMLSVDAAYVHSWWKDIGDNYSSGVSTTYQDLSANNFVLSLAYRF